MEEEEKVNQPKHYTKHSAVVKFEPIELVERCGFLLGNAFKYCFRWKDKGMPLTDLQKAQWYINRLLSEGYDCTVNDGVPPEFILNLFIQEDFIVAYLRGDNDVERAESLKAWIDEKVTNLERSIKNA